MKKLFAFVLLLTIIFLSFSACVEKQADSNNSSKNFASEKSEPKEKDEYEFYVDYAWGNEIPNNTNDFKPVSELHMGLGRKKVILSDVQKKFNFNIKNKEIILNYTSTSVLDPQNLKSDKYNRCYNEYSGNDNENYITVKTRNDTGDICYYALNVNDSFEAPLLKDEDYKKKATNELNKRLPDGWDKTYTNCEIVDDKSSKFICATFTRSNTFNCSFQEFIHVYMDYDGRVNCFDARMYGLFDDVIQTVTQEKIDSAYNAIKERLVPEGSKNTLSSSQMLHLDNNGILYISMGYTEVSTNESGDDCTSGAQVYVNVK